MLTILSIKSPSRAENRPYNTSNQNREIQSRRGREERNDLEKDLR
jgi:hypothetical protein